MQIAHIAYRAIREFRIVDPFSSLADVKESFTTTSIEEEFLI